MRARWRPAVVPLALIAGARRRRSPSALANGWLVACLGIPPFVATLGTLGIAQGLALVVTDGQSVVGIRTALPRSMPARWLGLPLPIVIALVAYAAVPRRALPHPLRHLRLRARRQPRGAALAGVAPNELPDRASTRSAALMAGFAALLMTARMNAGHPTAGLGLEFDAIAAVARRRHLVRARQRLAARHAARRARRSAC